MDRSMYIMMVGIVGMDWARLTGSDDSIIPTSFILQEGCNMKGVMDSKRRWGI